MGSEREAPVGWPCPRRSFGRVLTVVVAWVFATAGWVMFAVLAVGGGGFGDLLTMLVSAAFFSLVGAVVASRMRQPRPVLGELVRGVDGRGESGVAFGYAVRPYLWNVGFVAVITLALAGFTVIGTGEGGWGGWVSAVLCALVGVGGGWVVTSMVRGAPGGLVVTESGIYHHTPAIEQFVPWEAVRDVVARPENGGLIVVAFEAVPRVWERTRGGLLGHGAGGRPFLVFEAYWLGANAVPAYRLLRRCFDNSDDRRLLASGDLGSA